MGNTCKSMCPCCCKGKTEDPSKVEPEVKPLPVQPPPKEPVEPDQKVSEAPEVDHDEMGKELGVSKYIVKAMDKEFKGSLADDNKDGQANRAEMRTLMTKLYASRSTDSEFIDKQVDEHFEELDKDNSGKIAFKEFCTLWYKNNKD